MEAVKRPYTIQEEIWSSLIHGIGIALSIAGLIVLVTLAAQDGNVWVVVSTAIFGVSMVVLYTASTLYHAIPNPEIKLKLKKFDHISIYYLIAGTYTPFMLVNMRGPVGWTVFGIIWGACAYRNRAETVYSGQRHQGLVNWPLSADGVAGGVCIQAAGGAAAGHRPDFSGPGRSVLYAGNFLLCLEKPSVYACRLAFFRTFRNRYALFCRALFLCASLNQKSKFSLIR